MTRDEAIQIISALGAAFPKTDLPLASVEVYVQFLSDIPFEAGKIAAYNHIGECKWFPTVSELRQAAVGAMPGNQLPTSAEAWTEVLKQIRYVGHYGVPTFSHFAIKLAVDSMGWRNICLSEDTMADRAHFLKIYEIHKTRIVSDQLLLPEVREMMNQMKSLPSAESHTPEKVLSLEDYKQMARDRGFAV